MEQNKSIRYTIITISVFILVMCVMTSFLVNSARADLYAEKIQYLSEVANKSAELVESHVDGSLETLSAIAMFIGEHISLEPVHWIPILKKETANNRYKRMGIILASGETVTTDNVSINLGDREYFKASMKGERCVSEVLDDKVSSGKINVFSVPIYVNDEISAVLFATLETSYFSTLLSIESFDNEGYSYIIKSTGVPILYLEHKNSLGSFDNIFSEIKRNETDESIVKKLEFDLSNGNDGVFSFSRDGIPRQVSYKKTTINDWYVISVVPTKVISKLPDKLISNILVIATVIIISILFAGWFLLRFFVKNRKILEEIAFRDNVTGCSNWNKFRIDCEKLLRQENGVTYAMVSLDIDRFKVINDIYGHSIGNTVLQLISDILSKIITEKELFCRVSADNFDILLKYNNESELIKRIKVISDSLSDCISGYSINVFFGIYLIPFPHKLTIRLLCDRATLARINAKVKNDSFVEFYSEEIRNSILLEKHIENCMESALENCEFELYLQPKFRFDSGEIVGAEALVRWNHPSKGLMQPDSFIPIFEKNGFIRKLDKFMFKQACELLKKWKSANGVASSLIISVNLSRINLNNTYLPQELLEITNSYGLQTSNLEIEITESAVFSNIDKLISIMNGFKDVGFNISIDDFGSGYSSLNALRNLPADVIKLDKEFLDEATDDEKGKQIIKSLILMIKGLGLYTVAEGVETIEQVNFLRDAGCDIAQGYYFAKPMPVADFEKLVGHLH